MIILDGDAEGDERWNHNSAALLDAIGIICIVFQQYQFYESF